ncbi:hypothetical protein FB45DRAFT_1032069 [Roridomyces roridus]|uniref:Uncharacterized protein n=1 Tax=Roridomyces roridus TaxID=1738132 RepID=A0AAD7BJC6_9AGAR|nr:hypothetical protein FB45DRAFT_1032069 [Roridomyces roridus]
MSEEFWESLVLENKPKPREGVRTKLYRLTGRAKVLGYVKLPLYMETKEKETVLFELEAYVVRNMKVPLLLGEDFQTSYELGVDRWATGASEVRIGKTRHIIPASSSHAVDLGFEIRQASVANSMKRLLPGVWRKTYQRSKARIRREGQSKNPPVLAEQDVLIAPGSVHNVRVTGAFEDREEWLVETVVISMEDESVLAAPTTMLNSKHPYLPVANTSARPWYIRAGDVIGKLYDPSTYADKPKSEEELQKYTSSAEALARVIQESINTQDRSYSKSKESSCHALTYLRT